MAKQTFKLADLVQPGYSDSISGRDTGIAYENRIHLLDTLQKGDNVEIVIDGNYVKAINDSFIKGLFSKVFESYKTADAVKRQVKIVADDYFVRLFEKNWYILQSLVTSRPFTKYSSLELEP